MMLWRWCFGTAQGWKREINAHKPVLKKIWSDDPGGNGQYEKYDLDNGAMHSTGPLTKTLSGAPPMTHKCN